MNRSSTARIFLAMNSAFSAFTGIALLSGAGLLSPAIFAHPVDWAPIGMRLLGLGLLGFAGTLAILAANKFVSKAAVNGIVVLDILWVIGSAGVLLYFVDLLTAVGIEIIVIVAAAVSLFALGQFIGAGKITTPLPVAAVSLVNGNLIASVKRKVDAPTETVWEVMTDHPAYADVASNIAKVEVLYGSGLGMKRRCYGPKGESWEETCDLFEPGRSYGFRIHTEAEDYPYPISELSGHWSVRSIASGSEFSIEITARPKGSAIAQFLFTTLARQQFKVILIDLADAWALRMEKEARA